MKRLLGWLWLCLLCGCAAPQISPTRPFEFSKDTFAYENELVWEYRYDSQGRWTTHDRIPEPDYSHHCFVVARATLQFFCHARFDPEAPPADEQTYRRLIRQVVSTNPRRQTPEGDKIVIPGYADLRAFSEAYEDLLKAECGGPWVSYVQRGHWRMIFPFSRKSQEQMSRQLLAEVAGKEPVVVHVVRFPQLTINHALVLFDAVETDQHIEFLVYDPNQTAKPEVLTFDRSTRTFVLPPNHYFPGGPLDVYQVYHRWNY